MKIIPIITDPAVGGTFLTWSLHFLSDHKTYYHVKSKKWIPVTNNPLTGINAHKFLPNQPVTFGQFERCLQDLLSCQSQEFHTLYFHNLIEDPYSPLFLDTKKATEIVSNLIDKKIVLTNQTDHLLYEKSYRARAPSPSFQNSQIRLSDAEEQFQDFVEFFFSDSLHKWNALGLTEIWDRREFLALNYRHHKSGIADHIDLSKQHYSLDSVEWFNTGDTIITDLFDYLELKIDQVRFEQWRCVYQDWRKLHYQRLNFLWGFKKIVNYIISGKFMDLRRYNLDLYQEAIIQHELIYKYNLNLKTYKLEKFIDTLQLHQLLEPNIHTLQNNTLNNSTDSV